MVLLAAQITVCQYDVKVYKPACQPASLFISESVNIFWI